MLFFNKHYKGGIIMEILQNWDRKDDNGNEILFDNFVNLHCHSYYSLLDLN
jgi:hypothetical protein